MKKLLLTCMLVLSATAFFAQPLITTTNTSSPAACDGTAFFTDSSNINPNSVSWATGGAIIQQGNCIITNLCDGVYTVTYLDFLGNPITISFTIGGGPTLCNGYSVSITSVDASSGLSCDGSANVTVSNGTAPFMYQWSNGSTVQNEMALCLGSYTCSVTDANGCVGSAYTSINDGSGLTIDSILIFTNNSYPAGTVIDTLYLSTLEDCAIDYGSVGSASITNYAYITVDTVLITWTLLDTNGLIVAVYDIPYFITNPAAGVFSATLIVFCSQKTVGYNTIQITDQVYLNSAEMGILEVENAELSIINPFNENIQISFNELSKGTATLFDMSGKIVLETAFSDKQILELNTINVKAGTYFLTVKTANVVVTRKLIK